jgi:cobalt-zinc-cadmium efflux system outer membrane protein
LLVGLGLLALGGCLYPVREEVDHTVCNLADHVIDPGPPGVAGPSQLPPPSPTGQPAQDPGKEGAAGPSARVLLPVRAEEVQQPQPMPPGPKPKREPLRIPPELPGANAPEVTIPGIDAPEAEKERIVREQFPPLPELGQDPQPLAGPDGRPLTLSDLQHLALANNPNLREAAADIYSAEGAARQAGAYPNPTTGYETDTAGTGGLPGYQGWFFDQTIRTAGKLKLAQAAAFMDLENNKIALRRAQTDLETSVRNAYFAVLVAHENMRVTAALARVTDQAYGLMLARFRGGIAAYYEPTQLRVYAFQARGALVQARHSYRAAWTTLAATLGLPGMPPTELAGAVDMPVPGYDRDRALARVLTAHTDVLAARVGEQRARYNLRLQEVTPVPDVNLHLVVQKDFTTDTRSVVTTLQVGLPVPLWDQNQGAIKQAQGQLVRAVEEHHRVRDDLTSRLADAYQRYRSNLTLVEYYRGHILPDQVRFYRGVYLRYGEDPSVQFADVVNAQQTLGQAIATYVTTLTALFTAVSDMAGLLQTDDLFQVAPPHCLPPAPDLSALKELPCSHPCSPLQDPALKGAAAGWSAAELAVPASGDSSAGGPEFPLPSPRHEETSARPQPEATGPTLQLEAAGPEFAVPGPPPAPAGATPAQLPPVDDLPALPLPCPVPTAPPAR